MNTEQFFSFLSDNYAKLGEQVLEHIGLTFISLLLAVLIAVPSGIFIVGKKRLASIALGFAGILQTIPSIALLGFMLPLLGIGVKPAIFALFLYALLPIIRNTYTGIMGVDASVVEAARGMGMTKAQLLFKVELPLALPVIFAGIRTATVINVGVATLAAYIGAGGLGEFIFGGIALNNSSMILAGAIPAALLAILLDQLLALLQNRKGVQMIKPMMVLLILFPLFSFMYAVPDLFVNGLKAGFTPEFYGRKDGFPAIKKQYGLQFNTVILNSALMYQAVKEKDVDIISGYSTDGRIKAFDLRILQDDKHALPPYFCIPVIRNEVADQYPELVDALKLLSGEIDDSIMTEMNYEVDYLKRSPEAVANEFLKDRGLLKPDKATGGETITIGSKIFTEQYILVEIFSKLINGYTDLDVETVPGLGGTKICFDALAEGEIDLYPEYTGTALQVLLSPPDSLVRNIITQPDEVYRYVKQEFGEQYNLKLLPPLGFNNTYALMVLNTAAKENYWEKVSDLVANGE